MEEQNLEGWVYGFAYCRVCGYTWVAVTPARGENSNLECPNCQSMSGELGEESCPLP